MKKLYNRREVFGHVTRFSVAGVIGSASISQVFAADLKLVDPNTNPIAKAIKYVHDGSKAKRTDKMGVIAKNQACSNCALYKSAGKKVEKKDVGVCSMIAGHYVAAAGWCVSWVPGPTAKKG